jgi:uncharacterized membrane protein YuzA (DUF378 family)
LTTILVIGGIIVETFQKCALVLTILGAIFWGILGVFDYNVIERLFTDNNIERVIYVLIGIAGLINIALLFSRLYQNEKIRD